MLFEYVPGGGESTRFALSLLDDVSHLVEKQFESAFRPRRAVCNQCARWLIVYIYLLVVLL
jgi:hypothetical protein